MLHHLIYLMRPMLFQQSTASISGLSSEVRIFQSTTTASIDAFYDTETVHSFTTCPTGLNYFTQCVRYSLNQILHSMKDLLYRQDSFKVLQHLLKHSVTKQYYMFSKKYPTIPPKVSKSVFQVLISICFVWICQTWTGICMYESKVPRFQDLHKSC